MLWQATRSNSVLPKSRGFGFKHLGAVVACRTVACRTAYWNPARQLTGEQELFATAVSKPIVSAVRVFKKQARDENCGHSGRRTVRAGQVLLSLVFLGSTAAPQRTTVVKAKAASTGAAANVEVVKLLQAGMPETVVLEKIQTMSTKFDTSADALVALKRAGATEAELNAVLTHETVPEAKPKNETALVKGQTPVLPTANSTDKGRDEKV
jgi:hypothetical protein